MKILKNALKGFNPLLRMALLSGLCLLFLAGVFLSVFLILERSNTRISRRQDNFFTVLRNVDYYLNDFSGTGREVELIDKDIDRLEKLAISAESWLSILKRRKILFEKYPASLDGYVKSIDNALKAFPGNQHIAAAAAAAIVKDSAITPQNEEKLRSLLPLFTDPEFNNFRLYLHIILGDFRNPRRADQLPASLVSDGTQSVTASLAILKILRADYRGAASDIQSLASYPFLSDNSLRLCAEYYYDFGDLIRSAEIFSRMDDDYALIRQADALYLAGYADNAKAIWRLLSDSNYEAASEALEKSLYNLGVTSADSQDAALYLERLSSLENPANTDSLRYGLIRYSRLLDTSRAAALLQQTEGLSRFDYPFIDLELLKRLAINMELGRQIAEGWLLLERHPETEELYQWVSWLFLYQRNYGELRILLDMIEKIPLTAPWARLTQAVLQMVEGNLDYAQEILQSIPQHEASWAVYANLGRIQEAHYAQNRAIEQYELAMAKNPGAKAASKIQVRIARSYASLGNYGASLLALQYASDLDPENLTARLELDRLLY